jgi:hypothetical protein
MSRKHVKTKKLASAQSLAASFQMEWMKVSQLDNVGFVVSTAGVTDNTGTFSVQVRTVDSNTGEASPAATLTLDEVPMLTSTNTTLFINVNQLPADEIRLAFVPAGGTPDGTAAIWVNSKTVGA